MSFSELNFLRVYNGMKSQNGNGYSGAGGIREIYKKNLKSHL